ncbi:hypothetical protein A2757_02165 [Candidatus Giovannonibacteria bacterium RIFCSPHIGHO2_01_FULL_48_47]|nr:MAG: hypothetical protein A2757_02165 [Candidatus Giovannonibacteria bacterium RIFCSPHIGHO2_01_FULL_48_47]OGF68493.1 MAG: hypothetical protein A3D61_02590 [Candidatus Giovannonibacteria bacterium RIFCSPHIGHO2_02_FULL_48_15]OGF88456.1 MAG: hypothetical protein A3B26_01870 [Candidatus Giovannonibacteria bacterium RIFCSPLOWO2_01_FULL_48_47]OGF94885.1 MAG: hypothetical protein A2433_02350 [Candidatus Giovannonibacteria bacterium RIFOXYC1_FULL_48_8]OGF96514.1 MAG: hypothetical protein A2613_03110
MDNLRYAPNFSSPEEWSERDRYYLAPFVTSMDGLVSVLRNLPPELAGALCSRASRASDSLLRVLLKEYIYPVLEGEDKELAAELEEVVAFFHAHGLKSVLNNKKAQQFYAKWLAAYGDDSIAQMAGSYLVMWGISQVSMKFIEDFRIGLAPIEKSTRYVDFSKKTGSKYLYYTDPDIKEAGLEKEYTSVMDFLFETNADFVSRLKVWLKEKFPEEKDGVIEKKAFDTARGLLPMSTLGQVAFFGNGQAFEYMISNALQQKLGELRWIAEASKNELSQEIGSLLLRLDDEKSKNYQKYLAGKKGRIKPETESLPVNLSKTQVDLVDYTPDGEAQIVAGILFPASKSSWAELIAASKKMSAEEKKLIIAKYLEGRTERWHKVGRAFENAYLRFEIAMNAGAYRDLHRHRMHTQERQLFTVVHGYDVPPEIEEAGMTDKVHQAMAKVEELYQKIAAKLGEEHAQYATTLFHRVRFYQYQNVRQAFWEIELRTGPQGHLDYRHIEQQKFKLIEKVYPIIAPFIKADMSEYDFARRGLEEKIQKKEERLIEKMGF